MKLVINNMFEMLLLGAFASFVCLAGYVFQSLGDMLNVISAM